MHQRHAENPARPIHFLAQLMSTAGFPLLLLKVKTSRADHYFLEQTEII